MSRLLPWSVALAALTAVSAARAQMSPQPGAATDITIDNARAGATPGPVRNGAVYLTVTDRGQPDRITGVSTPIAMEAGMHESSNDKGVMRMRPIQSLPIGPGAPVTFAPGGYHIMITGLQHPLKAGDTFPLTLTFERSAPVTAAVTVERAGARTRPNQPSMDGMAVGRRNP